LFRTREEDEEEDGYLKVCHDFWERNETVKKFVYYPKLFDGILHIDVSERRTIPK